MFSSLGIWLGWMSYFDEGVGSYERYVITNNKSIPFGHVSHVNPKKSVERLQGQMLLQSSQKGQAEGAVFTHRT